MEKLAWATDVHLDCCSPEVAYDALIAPTLASGAQALLLTGDIADAPALGGWIAWLTDALAGRPLYFVLGNHDAYRGTIAAARRTAAQAAPPARWLGDGQPVDLGGGTWLVGHSGWGDARLGDFLATPVRLNDHRLIGELSGLPDRRTLQQRLQALGDEAAAILQRALDAALAAGARRILVATHVPPWREACWHAGAQPPEDSPWLPDFTCAATGALLTSVAAGHPGVSFVVLCGHSHGAGVHRVAPGLVVHTGGAAYGAPALAGLVGVAGLEVLPPR